MYSPLISNMIESQNTLEGISTCLNSLLKNMDPEISKIDQKEELTPLESNFLNTYCIIQDILELL